MEQHRRISDITVRTVDGRHGRLLFTLIKNMIGRDYRLGQPRHRLAARLTEDGDIGDEIAMGRSPGARWAFPPPEAQLSAW